MKHLGHCHEKGRADREKWGYPKVHMVKGQNVCDCKDPCITAKKGRTTYTYENMDFRRFPGIQRDSDEWTTLYKLRTVVNVRSITLRSTCALLDGSHDIISQQKPMYSLLVSPASSQLSLRTD